MCELCGQASSLCLMKTFLQHHGVDVSDCVENRELLQREEATERKAASSSSSSSSSSAESGSSSSPSAESRTPHKRTPADLASAMSREAAAANTLQARQYWSSRPDLLRSIWQLASGVYKEQKPQVTPLNFKLFRFGESPQSSLHGSVAWSIHVNTGAIRRVVFAVRGTANLDNVITDLAFSQTPLKRNTESAGKVHTGFWKASETLKKGIYALLEEIEAIRSWVRHIRIYVVGHSLGGALAVLCAVSIEKMVRLKQWSDCKIRVITFGQPSVGDEVFVRFYNKLRGGQLGVYTTRMVTYCDPIPLLPHTGTNALRGGIVYKHVGTEVQLVDGPVSKAMHAIKHVCAISGEKRFKQLVLQVADKTHCCPEYTRQLNHFLRCPSDFNLVAVVEDTYKLIGGIKSILRSSCPAISPSISERSTNSFPINGESAPTNYGSTKLTSALQLLNFGLPLMNIGLGLGNVALGLANVGLGLAIHKNTHLLRQETQKGFEVTYNNIDRLHGITQQGFKSLAEKLELQTKQLDKLLDENKTTHEQLTQLRSDVQGGKEDIKLCVDDLADFVRGVVWNTVESRYRDILEAKHVTAAMCNELALAGKNLQIHHETVLQQNGVLKKGLLARVSHVVAFVFGTRAVLDAEIFRKSVRLLSSDILLLLVVALGIVVGIGLKVLPGVTVSASVFISALVGFFCVAIYLMIEVLKPKQDSRLVTKRAQDIIATQVSKVCKGVNLLELISSERSIVLEEYFSLSCGLQKAQPSEIVTGDQQLIELCKLFDHAVTFREALATLSSDDMCRITSFGRYFSSIIEALDPGFHSKLTTLLAMAFPGSELKKFTVEPLDRHFTSISSSPQTFSLRMMVLKWRPDLITKLPLECVSDALAFGRGDKEFLTNLMQSDEREWNLQDEEIDALINEFCLDPSWIEAGESKDRESNNINSIDEKQGFFSVLTAAHSRKVPLFHAMMQQYGLLAAVKCLRCMASSKMAPFVATMLAELVEKYSAELGEVIVRLYESTQADESLAQVNALLDALSQKTESLSCRLEDLTRRITGDLEVRKCDMLDLDLFNTLTASPHAKCLLARYYKEQKSEEDLNKKRAFRLFRDAARSNYPDGQYELGLCFENARGVKFSADEALLWVRRAADQCHSEAQFHLGVLYEKGAMLKRDDTLAEKWFTKAAEAGSMDAKFSLSMLCERVGNTKMSHMWLEQASKDGHREALKMIERYKRQTALGAAFVRVVRGGQTQDAHVIMYKHRERNFQVDLLDQKTKDWVKIDQILPFEGDPEFILPGMTPEQAQFYNSIQAFACVPLHCGELSNRRIPDKTLVVAFLGPTGTGKSQLINYLLGDSLMVSNASTESVTKSIEAASVIFQTKGKVPEAKEIFLVDTIGMCDKKKSNTEIFNLIQDTIKVGFNKLDLFVFVLKPDRVLKVQEEAIEQAIDWFHLSDGNRKNQVMVIITHCDVLNDEAKQDVIKRYRDHPVIGRLYTEFEMKTDQGKKFTMSNFFTVGLPDVSTVHEQFRTQFEKTMTLQRLNIMKLFFTRAENPIDVGHISSCTIL
eukprot:gb/GEZN01000339.1/.p1 GENE.gb/GEZN01000339.1/~~gb/GEZN01000339.1/.p1  ORF type:complete len:1548 (+),score=217.18 gb/GEZN01000339.1/:211-4854(+)